MFDLRITPKSSEHTPRIHELQRKGQQIGYFRFDGKRIVARSGTHVVVPGTIRSLHRPVVHAAAWNAQQNRLARTHAAIDESMSKVVRNGNKFLSFGHIQAAASTP